MEISKKSKKFEKKFEENPVVEEKIEKTKYISREKFVDFDSYYRARKSADMEVVEKCENCGKEFATLEDKTLYFAYTEGLERKIICSECAEKILLAN